MKQSLALLLIAVLLTALFAACGGQPADAEVTQSTTAETTFAIEAPTTEASTTTMALPSTAEAIRTTTTAKPPASNTAIPEIAGSPPGIVLLAYKMDENGYFYTEHERWTKDTFEPEMLYGSSPQHREPPVQVAYGTVRVKFQYAGQDRMIQMWKGRYGLMMLGCEIAVLKKPAEQQAEHYLPAEPSEELAIAADVYQHNFLEGSTKKLFSRSVKSAWWFNGFMPGGFYEFNKKSEIIVVGSITFPDQEMLQAFEASFKKIGFKQGTPDSKHPETYAIKDNTLKFSWQYIDQDA